MNNGIRDFEIYGITGYTVMSNYHFHDKNLSIKAKGLLGLMLSLPKDWDYSINGLVTLSKDGKDSVKSGLNELKQAEYLKIEKYKDENGLFRYKYLVYYLPYPKWLEMKNLTRYGNSTLEVENPDTDFPAPEVPDMENPTQLKNNKINNNNKKDKIDKTQDLDSSCEEIKHSILTKELIRRNYISEDDSSSFLFDDFFKQLIKEGYHYKDLLIMSNYVVSRIKENNFKDENGYEIQNKYGYFKNSLISNINRFNNVPEDLYSDEDSLFDYDWLNDDKEDLEL